ncbi:MAG: FtsX-like permease family protein [Phycisphaerae bacterium]|nr:FtsX-like permease family protein [Phycisphaerae bacterium]
MYKLILSLRYMFKRRITYLSILSVSLCVFMAVVVITVMTGLLVDFKEKNHNYAGDCIISTDSLVGFPYYQQFLESISKETFIEAASPVIKSYAILSYQGSYSNTNVEIMGIDPASFSKVTNFADTLYYHKNQPAAAFEPSYDTQLPGCVLGIDLALSRDQFGKYSHSDFAPMAAFEITSFPLTPKGAPARAGLGLVSNKTFYYSDDSHSGLAKVDGSVVYLPFDHAQQLCGMSGQNKRVTAIHIKIKDNSDLDSAAQKLQYLWNDFKASKKDLPYASLLNNVKVQTWKQFRRASIAAVETEQIMMILSFIFIALISIFIVFVVFYMIVSHKRKDIGILKSIGISKINIISIFLLFAFFVGLLSSLIGTVGGIIFLGKINPLESWLYEHFGFQLWNRMVYAIDLIPNKIEIEVIFVIALAAILACLSGSAIPAYQAAKMQPAESLQVNQL